MNSPLPPPPFSGIATFNRQPFLTSSEAVDLGILGIPYDSSTSNRSGTRLGPRAIREQSLLLWGYNNVQQVAPFEVLRGADFGDVDVVPVSITKTHAAIQQRASEIIQDGTHLIALGGDHSITLPLLRAHALRHGPLAVVHFDAHPDTWDYEYPGQPYSHGTPFIRAIEEGLIDTNAYFQLGIRGPTGSAQDYLDARRLGARMVTLEEFRSRTVADVLAEIVSAVGAKPTYVTFDIDCVDPAFAPGTGTPEVGGITSHEALQLVRGLVPLNCVGFDMVEVSPPHDHAGITAILAANLVFEFASIVALNRAKPSASN